MIKSNQIVIVLLFFIYVCGCKKDENKNTTTSATTSSTSPNDTIDPNITKYGYIRVFIRPYSKASKDVIGAKVNIAFSYDSLVRKLYCLPEATTDNTGRVNYNKLILNKVYHFTAKYTEIGTGKILTSKDTFANANLYNLPTNLLLIVN